MVKRDVEFYMELYPPRVTITPIDMSVGDSIVPEVTKDARKKIHSRLIYLFSQCVQRDMHPV